MIVTEKQPKSVNFINGVQTLFHDVLGKDLKKLQYKMFFFVFVIS